MVYNTIKERNNMKKNTEKDKITKKDIFIAILIILSGFIIHYFIEINHGTGLSMYPTHDDGCLAVSSTIHKDTEINRYDIVNTKKIAEDNNKKLTKRVIGLPGETVTIKGKDIYINGEKIDDPYAYYDENKIGIIQEGKPVYLDGEKLDVGYKFNYCDITSIKENEDGIYITSENTWVLGDDEYFLMGDNRCSSKDSRTFGSVKRNKLSSIEKYYLNTPF